jgi:hypothetical protein
MGLTLLSVIKMLPQSNSLTGFCEAELRGSGKKVSLLEKYAVILIDMQKSQLEDVDETEKKVLINSQVELLNYCAKEDIPVVVLEYVEKDYPDNEKSTIYCLNQFIEKVPRKKYLKKNDLDGFTNPELEKQLSKWNATKLCLTGVYATSCVTATAAGATKTKKFRFCTSPDLVANPKCLEKNLEWCTENGTLYEDHKKLIEEIEKNKNFSSLIAKKRPDFAGTEIYEAMLK